MSSNRHGASLLSNSSGASDFRQARNTANSRKSRNQFLKAGIMNELSLTTQFIPVIGNTASVALSAASTVESIHAQGFSLSKKQIEEIVGGSAIGLAAMMIGGGMFARSELTRITGQIEKRMGDVDQMTAKVNDILRQNQGCNRFKAIVEMI
jgi:hypothetical protein